MNQVYMAAAGGALRVFGFDMRHPWILTSVTFDELGIDEEGRDPERPGWFVKVEAVCPRCSRRMDGAAFLENGSVYAKELSKIPQ